VEHQDAFPEDGSVALRLPMVPQERSPRRRGKTPGRSAGESRAPLRDTVPRLDRSRGNPCHPNIGHGPREGESVPPKRGAVPREGESVPWGGESVPQKGEPSPREGAPIPQEGEPFPREGTPVPRKGEASPREGGLVPRKGGASPYRRAGASVFENPVTMYVPERWSFFSFRICLRSASSRSSEKEL
jgi:hypothetical protein